ncbi:MAG: N4-gp56 family major capsid protein [Sulfurimonas sp.]|nr:N4-gp56 family major capsid protein [Sulfurimonas sp.]
MGTYNNGANSSIDQAAGNPQIRQEHYNKNAIIEIKDEMYLSQMSGSISQPKNKGKEVVKHRYLPLLSDENSVANSGIDPDGITLNNGNLYASSRSVGIIEGRLPDLTETSERANKVNFSRKEVRGSIKNRGFFFEFSKDEMNFDTDKMFKQHVTTEALRGASQINEDILGIELIDKAGVVFNAGSGQDRTLDGSNTDDSDLLTIDNTSVPNIRDLIRLDIELDNNKCPRDTKVIVGSNYVDTKTIASARYMFISPDVKMDFMSIKALNGADDAFIPLNKYEGESGNKKYIKSIHGEIGAVGPFRIIVHPKMVIGEGEGALIGVETDSFVLETETDAMDTGETSLTNVVVYNVTQAAALTATTDYTVANGVVTIVDTAASAIGDTIHVSYDDDGTSGEYRSNGTNYNVYHNLVIGSEAFTHIGFEFGPGTAGKFDVTTMSPEELRDRKTPYAKVGMTVIEWWNGVLVDRPDWLAVYNTVSKY